MAQKVIVEAGEWKEEKNRYKYAKALERSDILFFPQAPFEFPKEDIAFLLQQRQGASKSRKNIAYKPQLDRVTNHISKDPVEKERMKEVLRRYSREVTQFLTALLPPYAKAWKHDYASFRPFQEQGRALRLRARNDLLHVDAFPTRPLHGARILRFFTNINPVESRRWITSEPFEKLAAQFGGQGVPFPAPIRHSFGARLERKMKQWVQRAGFPVRFRSPYDSFMLQMHNFLKENGEFQAKCVKEPWEFPPNSCWAVFTDSVSHAALSGQYALEQTLLIPPKALVLPELAPVHVLERLSNRTVSDRAALEKMFAG